jgi:parvulin-like peptidyl-prolyl isomerase
MVKTITPVFFLLLFLVSGNSGSTEAKRPTNLGTGDTTEQGEEKHLSNAQYQSFLKALQLENRKDWEIRLRSDVNKILLLSNQAQLSKQQQRRIEFAADGTLQRRQIRQWRRQLLGTIQLDRAERDSIDASVVGDIQRPAGWLLWNVFLAWPEGADTTERARTRARLGEIRSAIIGGADFSEQARRFSHSSSRYLGGRIGWVRLERIGPSLREAIEQLDSGDYSPIVESRKGAAFYFAEKVRPAQTISRAEQIDKRRQSELKKKRKQAWANISKQAQQAAEADLQQRWAVHGKTHIRQTSDKILKGAAPIALQDLIHWNSAFSQTRNAVQLSPRDLALAFLRTKNLAAMAAESSKQPTEEMRSWLIHYFRAQSEFNRLAALQADPVNEEEIEQYFNNHQGDFQAPPQWDASLIQFDYNTENQLEVKSLAHRVSEQIRKGELSFAEAAKRYSTAPSAAKQGRLGSKNTRQLLFLDPIALQTLKTMDAGQIEGPIPGNGKLMLLLLHAKSPAIQKPLSEVREQIREALQEKKRRHAGDEILFNLAER